MVLKSTKYTKHSKSNKIRKNELKVNSINRNRWELFHTIRKVSLTIAGPYHAINIEYLSSNRKPKISYEN